MTWSRDRARKEFEQVFRERLEKEDVATVVWVVKDGGLRLTLHCRDIVALAGEVFDEMSGDMFLS